MSKVQGDLDTTTILEARMLLDRRLLRTMVQATSLEPHRVVIPGRGISEGRLLEGIMRARRWHRFRALLLPASLLTALVEPIAVAPTWLGLLLLTSLYAKVVLAPRALLRQDFVDLTQSSNNHVTIYSGFRPFVGAGYPRENWGVPIDISEPADPEVPIADFDVDYLTNVILGSLQLLQLPDREILGSSTAQTDVERRYYVHGEDLPPELLSEQKLSRKAIVIPSQRDLKGAAGAREEVREYLAVEVPRWNDDTVTSVFVRLSECTGSSWPAGCGSRTLFLEVSEWILPSLEQSRGSFERFVHGVTFRDILAEPLALLIDSWALLFHLWWEVTLPSRRKVLRSQARRKLSRGLAVDRGTEHSLRELASGTKYNRYFQYTDHDRDVKLIQLAIIRALRSALQACGVDVSNFDDRVQTIENNNLIISADGASLGAVSVGSKSKSSVNGGESRNRRGKVNVSTQ